MKKILLVLLTIMLVSVAVVKQMVYADGALNDETVILIKRGATSSAVANELYKARVINNPLLFKVVARLQGLDKHLKAGEYLFEPKISMIDVLEKMNRGDVMYRQITIPEGLTVAQIAEIINNNEYLSGEILNMPSEGTLLPETYTFLRGDTREDLLKKMSLEMDKLIDKVWQQRDVHLPIKNAKELMVLASIVEKETAVPEERGLVASVFVNRLRKGMRLQTDPTVIYALTGGKKDLGRTLLRKDLSIDSPYNTYKYYGLPPAPICNPGKKAVEAAANPEISDYLYFVASGNGGHNFATSLEEHNKNVRRWKRSKAND